MTTPPSDPTPPGPELPPPPAPYHPPTDPWASYGGRPQQYAAPPRAVLGEPDQRESRTMAGWALGLAIVPCCGGITTLVGIGLAITVLVRSRNGLNYGKGLAISALVIGALWLIGGVVAVALGVFNDLTQDAERDTTGQVTGRDDMAVAKIRTGDCVDYPELFGSTTDEEVAAATVTAVPCEEAHQFEAYRTFDLPGDSYPGNERVQRLASEGCFRTFRAFVGKPYGRSSLEPSYLYPTAPSWRIMGDHSVTCLIGQPGELTTGTLEHSRR